MRHEELEREIEALFGHPCNVPWSCVDDRGIQIDGRFATLDQLQKYVKLIERYYQENGLCPF